MITRTAPSKLSHDARGIAYMLLSGTGVKFTVVLTALIVFDKTSRSNR